MVNTTRTGSREQKQTETRSRIALEGIRLFERHGYDATTLEAVAVASGISPRTLYHYFKTKYDILLFFHDEGFIPEISPTIQSLPRALGPLAVALRCLMTLVPKYETESMAATYRIWSSTEKLKAEKLLAFKQIELAIYEALREVWPKDEEQDKVKSAAMAAAGALRLAMDAGQAKDSKKSLQNRLEDSFQALTELLRQA